MGYDIIGDIHGQIGKLESLLAKLGYRRKDGAYRHPEGRTALFLGDLVDRGPGQVAVVNIVREMIDHGTGRCVLGNHEWNAIGYATENADKTGYLRPHTEGKRKEHAEFLRQVGEGSSLHRELVEWFKTLPPFLDLGSVRICHAWWRPESIAHIGRRMNLPGGLDAQFILDSFDRCGADWRAMEDVTKGMELALPEGAFFYDHDGTARKDIRVKWWDEDVRTYREAALISEKHRNELPPLALPSDLRFGPTSAVPTFVGHYWLKGTPRIQNASTAVVDYSAGGDGPLVAYRWEGELVLSDAGFVASH